MGLSFRWLWSLIEGWWHPQTDLGFCRKKTTKGTFQVPFFIRLGDRDMGLLFDAATAWNALQDTTYELLLGRGKNSTLLTITFCADEFWHLVGMQHVDDVDFRLNRAELRGSKFLSKVLTKKVNDELITKTAEWDKIQGRLECLIAIESIFDSDFLIFNFNYENVPHGTMIAAKYVIKDQQSGATYFVFLDTDKQRWFCKSALRLRTADFSENQSRMTVLKKIKKKGGVIKIDYTHPHYDPSKGNNK